MQTIKVEQEELVIVTLDAQEKELITEGVSTCICFLAKGWVGRIPFLAMYHWDGFPERFDKFHPEAEILGLSVVKNIIKNIAQSIHQTSKRENQMFSRSQNQSPPQLQALYLVGGERSSEYLSGTELEVEILKKYAKTCCDQYFTLLPNSIIEHFHYLTCGSQSKSICFGFNHLEIIDGYLSEDNSIISI